MASEVPQVNVSETLQHNSIVVFPLTIEETRGLAMLFSYLQTYCRLDLSGQPAEK